MNTKAVLYTEAQAREAWWCVRTNNHSIPDEVLDNMKDVLLAAVLASADHPSTAGAAQSTDISQRLRTALANCGAGALLEPLRADIMAATEEIERYYGGMLAWKKTAEKKDRDWQAERMGRVDDRIASRLAAPVAQSTAGAAKGGITSLEGLARYKPTLDDLGSRVAAGMMRTHNGEYVRLADVTRLAAPALNPSEVRDQALEEAAQICMTIGNDWLDAGDHHKEYAADYLAKAIRALRTASKEGK